MNSVIINMIYNAGCMVQRFTIHILSTPMLAGRQWKTDTFPASSQDNSFILPLGHRLEHDAIDEKFFYDNEVMMITGLDVFVQFSLVMGQFAYESQG